MQYNPEVKCFIINQVQISLFQSDFLLKEATKNRVHSKDYPIIQLILDKLNSSEVVLQCCF